MTIPRLDTLAATAVHHALQVHGVALAADATGLAAVDAILDREAGAAGEQAAALAACYGAWLGSLAVRELGAAWTALDEPVAPRLRVAGVVVSPIDAVRRRLAAPATAPTLAASYAQLRAWAVPAPAPDRAAALAQNQAAWTALAGDPRFAGDDAPPPDRETATAALDPWLRAEGVAGREVLCLGAGGGRQGPLLAAAGARVTVVDLSDAQLEHDRRAAAAHGLALRAVRASLDELGALGDAAFAVVVQPVSACYVPDLEPLHREVARVLRPGGLYVAQHKQPASQQADPLPSAGGYLVRQPYRDHLALPPLTGAAHREARTAEFLHTLGALLGGLCRAGFAIEDVAEPTLADAWAPPGSAEHRACILPPYLALKVRRRSASAGP